MNTSIKQKRKFWPKFVAACESQWSGGGKRYALTEDKEFTDLVCEAGGEYGNQWIGQNIIKYVGELMNAKRAGEKMQEVNFMKIAVYSFLYWIKEQENLTQRDEGEEFSFDSEVVEAEVIELDTAR